jgi:hypothetical protein
LRASKDGRRHSAQHHPSKRRFAAPQDDVGELAAVVGTALMRFCPACTSRLSYAAVPMLAASAAARRMLDDISLVTTLCSSTDAAVLVTYSLTF